MTRIPARFELGSSEQKGEDADSRPERQRYLRGNVDLVLLADGEAGAGDGELDEEDQEEDDHVDEQHHLKGKSRLQ